MSYHNYREKKEKELVELIKRQVVKTVTDGEARATEEKQMFFDLEVKRFSEEDGTLHPQPERYELDPEALAKERVLLEGFIDDIDELLDDIEKLKKEGE